MVLYSKKEAVVRGEKLQVYKDVSGLQFIKFAFLLENPVSDLGNPDCLASYVSWSSVHHPQARLRTAIVCLFACSERPRGIELELVRQMERTI